MCEAVATLAARGPLLRHVAGRAGVHLLDPLDPLAMVALLGRATLVLTDSGGLQEETPALCRPVLVLRFRGRIAGRPLRDLGSTTRLRAPRACASPPLAAGRQTCFLYPSKTPRDDAMKLLRYGPPGAEKPGMLDASGTIRDLSGVMADITGAVLSPASLAKIAALDPSKLPAVTGNPRIGPPVTGMKNLVCIGLNYADHAAETGAPIPKEPIVFLKSLNALSGPNDDVVIPRNSVKTDWEVELAVIIGTRAKYVSEENALDHVAGYAVGNDVSEREWQAERGGAWDKGKGFDTFGPLGPWLVTKDEIPDPQNLAMFCDVDGVRQQDGSTRTMIFGVKQVVSYVSQCITLNPGDVIFTGTPPGVGLGKKPVPVFLKAGQVMRLGIAGLGEQQQKLVASD